MSSPLTVSQVARSIELRGLTSRSTYRPSQRVSLGPGRPILSWLTIWLAKPRPRRAKKTTGTLIRTPPLVLQQDLPALTPQRDTELVRDGTDGTVPVPHCPALSSKFPQFRPWFGTLGTLGTPSVKHAHCTRRRPAGRGQSALPTNRGWNAHTLAIVPTIAGREKVCFSI